MYIDFRVRPPYKSFLGLSIMTNWKNVNPTARTIRPTGFERRPVPSMDRESIDLMVREMDGANVVHGVITGRHTGDPVYGDVDNADVYEMLQKYPGRFSGLAGIAPTDANARDEIDKCVNQWGFKGISIDPGWCTPPVYASDKSFESILAQCHEMKLVTMITMSVYGGPDLTYSDPSTFIPLFKKYNQAKFVLAHACWPKVQEAIGVALLCPNVYLSPDSYFYVRNMPMQEAYAKAANSFLKYRFLFASSYPIRGFAQSVENWKERGLDSDSLQYSLYDNAAELLGL